MAVALVAMLSASNAVAKDPGRKFGKPNASRGFVSTQGKVRNPRGLFLRVVGTAGLEVSVTTVVECSQRGQKSRIKDGAFIEVASFTRRLGQTLPKPDQCFVSIVATYEHGEDEPLKTQLFARHPKRRG